MKSKIRGGILSAALDVTRGLVRAAAAASAVATFGVRATGPVGLGLLGIAGVLSAYSQVAYAGTLTICNSSRHNLHVAIAYDVGGGDIVSEGWWSVNSCGGCTQVLTQQQTTVYDQVYVHGEVDGSNLEEFAGQYRYCISGQRFKYMNSFHSHVNCTSKGFILLNVNLNKNWKQTLNTPGDTCYTY